VKNGLRADLLLALISGAWVSELWSQLVEAVDLAVADVGVVGTTDVAITGACWLGADLMSKTKH
jgi:hypothetical protein